MPPGRLAVGLIVTYTLVALLCRSAVVAKPAKSAEPPQTLDTEYNGASSVQVEPPVYEHLDQNPLLRMAADSPAEQREMSEDCAEKSGDELRDMLGPAFNGRYMSLTEPTEGGAAAISEQSSDVQSDGQPKPKVSRILPFHVEPDYKRELPPDFYMDISWYQEVINSLPESAARFLRRLRRLAQGPPGQPTNSLPWQCESEIVWTDLGANYYPRFLRNIRCTRESCWFGHFKCRAKAFTVNVLKRVRDSCKDNKYDQQWIYEERAVTFCCECVEH